MKALSLLQPWATLVVQGFKTIETRSWNSKHRGQLLIHASLGKKGSLLAKQKPFNNYIKDFKDLPFGSIIGEVTLKEILPIEELRFQDEYINQLTLEEKAFGDYTEGRYAWILENAVEYQVPVPALGMLGLWDFKYC